MSIGQGILDAERLDGEHFLKQLWRFARPHTIIGTSLSLFALWLMAAGLFETSLFFENSSSVTGTYPLGQGVVSLELLLLTWAACLGANVYIVGLNQLTDIPLDRINKPYLPLASGAWSVSTGWWVVGLSFGVSLITTIVAHSTYLYWTVGLSLLLGTVYSLPPFRLKRFNFWAAFCIIAVRSIIVNLLLFSHVAKWTADVRDLPPPVWLLTFVMFAFSIAIAWFKDLPDDSGDAAHGVDTLTVRLGRKQMLRAGCIVLIAALLLTAFGALRQHMFNISGVGVAIGQFIIALLFLWTVLRVKLDDKRSIRVFYLTMWALFFGEYLLFASAAWWV